MSSTVPISVAIYENPGIMHWSLFIEAESDDEKTIAHVPHRAHSAVQCRRIENQTIKNIAWDLPVRNGEPDYSCQDYVLDLLAKLEKEFIIDRSNDDYRRKKAALAAKRESWE
ncbi:hypothetical protein BDW69DRAFT_190244 [Aspergillus filifer]